MQMARIPWIGKLLFGDALYRVQVKDQKTVYLTFDDGPIPEVTPLVLDTLAKYNVKATFFCVGENVKKYPELYRQIIEEGHFVGNHTFNHLKGWKTPLRVYLENVDECVKYVSSDLFRPPYGKMTYRQYKVLSKKFKLVFWDVLTPDFDMQISAEKCLDIVKRKTRPGSILVFHDNLKAKNKLKVLLSGALDYLIQMGYEIQPVTNNILK